MIFSCSSAEPHADAAVDTEAERHMRARTGAVDDEAVGVLDDLAVAIARDVPHHDPVAFPDQLAAQFRVSKRSAAHVRERRLPADDLRDEAIDQRGIAAQLVVLIGIFIQREHRSPSCELRVVSLPPTIRRMRLPSRL